jgi:hypothetical protein
MAKQVINIGSAELAGDGETLRSALNKVNLNFTELYNDDADFETQFNAHINTATAGTNHILSWDGSDYVWRVDNDTIGIQYTDLSVNTTEGAAEGDGKLSYDVGNGVFTYSPPKLNGLIADGDTDFGANKITYSNMYASLVDLPDAVQYHGMFAHVHATGKAYFAHGGNWVELASQTDILAQDFAFSSLTGTPTTIAGYGITDALELGTTSTTALAGDTALLALGTTGTTALAGDTAIPSALTDLGITDGTANQVLTTDGSGNFTFATSGGLADTDALSEGTTNLYYTDARVNTYLSNNDYDTATNIVASITDSAPTTLDTLNELAAALGDDANFSTTVTNSIAEKLPLAGGTMTGDINVGGNSIVGGSSPINIAPGGSAKISLSGVTELGGNLEAQTYDITTTGKILYSNVYTNLVDLPSASTYHGMFAHVHATGKGYFAHGGNWVELANMSDVSSGGLANVVEDTTPQLGGDLDCQGFNITMDNGSISTTAGNLQISSFNYVTIDSANDGQIEIGKSSGLGDVIIGNESNGTSVTLQGVASFDEQVLMYKGAEEKYSALTGATGTVAHDCDNGKMFYHTTPAADWTANFTNLNLNQYKFSTSVGIVVTQGGTAYIPNAVEIGGVAQTIIWQGNSTPTGTDNGTDAISFTIMRDGSTYIVLGQLTSFGGV